MVSDPNFHFYSEHVYKSLIDVLDQCYGESVDYEYTERKKSEYFKEARKNQKEIVKSIENCCLAIRERIEEVKVI